MRRTLRRIKARERAPGEERVNQAGTRSRLCNAEGQSLVTIALMMPVILLVVGLVCEIGYAYALRRQMQNAADAGAIAAARALCLGGDAQQMATDYAQRNGATDVTVVIDGEQGTVRVTAQRSVPTFFARVVGLNQIVVGAQAGTMYGAVTQVSGGLYPIAVNWQGFDFDQTYDIWAGSGPGNLGWLGWDGCVSVPCLCDNLTTPGYDGRVAIEDMVPGSTGVANAGCVRDQLDALISSGTPLTIIVYDYAAGSGSGARYRVAGFARFILEDYRLPSGNRITGRFIQSAHPGTDIQPGAGYGLSGSRLTE